MYVLQVLNAVKMCQKWGNEMQCYTYEWENPEDAWIAVKNFRTVFELHVKEKVLLK